MIATLKSSLRAEALDRRRALGQDAAAGFAAQLAQTGLRMVVERRPAVVSAFFALPEEPSTLPLLAALAATGVSTALPITGPRGTPLVFRAWRFGEPTVKGRMGISEPLASAPEVDPDFLFVPLAAFDRQGHRIGYGAGYYDRSLAKLRALRPVCAVGVAYACQEVLQAPHEAHDEPLDYVLTERELIACGASVRF